MKHVKWTSIEGMHNVRRGLKAYQKTKDSFELPRVVYRAKVKLHGTNAGVQVHPDGTVVAQSRSNCLNWPHSDNQGFAKWVKENEKVFANLKPKAPMTIFGEWCGMGIQKGVSVCDIKKKVFAVFAIQFMHEDASLDTLIIDPLVINEEVPVLENVFVLPWLGVDVEIDWGDETSMQQGADKINEYVTFVEKCDPWVKENFGVSGTGEGVVMYPIKINGESTFPEDMRDKITTYMFKAKGEKHKVVAQKKPAQIDPEVAKGIDEFVKLVLTDARLEQGVQETGGSKIPKNTGAFIKWIGQDVKKECTAELEASGLEWKQVAKAVSKHASEWFRR